MNFVLQPFINSFPFPLKCSLQLHLLQTYHSPLDLCYTPQTNMKNTTIGHHLHHSPSRFSLNRPGTGHLSRLSAVFGDG
ncbi:hypothetical protein HanPSC8_Chr10g0433071 [Helianthus annuus]|nr:hypothetical protein HanPSC8_Chr10g0433071 [Helianthus annuus]